MKTRFRRPLVLAMLLATTFTFGQAQGRFLKGDTQVTASGGGGPTGFGLGAEIGHFLVDGLEVSLGAGYWSMEDTGLFRLTPGVRAVLDVESLIPYVGAFYRRWMFTDEAYSDASSYGLRGGSYFLLGHSTVIGLGIVLERLMDCDESQFSDCEFSYPEFSLAFQL